MKKGLGVIASVVLVFSGYYLFTKFNKTKPIEDSFQIQTENVITQTMTFTNDGKQDASLTDEEVARLAREAFYKDW